MNLYTRTLEEKRVKQISILTAVRVIARAEACAEARSPDTETCYIDLKDMRVQSLVRDATDCYRVHIKSFIF